MSPFDPPQSPNLPPQQDAFDAEMMPAGPAPMSGMAIAGFVSSVIVCCPVFSPLLGLIFSLVGLSQTKGGARRGRGLALAGLIISLLVVPLQGWGIPALAEVVGSWARIAMAATAFQGGDTDAGISAWYGLGSPELKSAFTEDEFASWINGEFTKRGGLQSLQLDSGQQGDRSSDGNRDRLPWQARFPDGTEIIYLELSTNSWGRIYLEDVVIGGAGLVASVEIDEADSDSDAPVTDDQDTTGEP